MTKTKFEKKLSARAIIGSAVELKKMALAIPADGGSVPLFRLVGLVSRVRTVESSYGESFGLRGEFQATRTSDGAKFASMEVFLPDFATQLVLGAFNAAKIAAGKDDVTVQISLDIGLKRRDDIAIGYEYTAEPVVPLVTSSPLQMLLDQTEAAKPLALAAPALDTTPPAPIPAPQPEPIIPAEPTPAPKKADEKKPETPKRR